MLEINETSHFDDDSVINEMVPVSEFMTDEMAKVIMDEISNHYSEDNGIVSAAYIYDRKGYANYAVVGEAQSSSYLNSDDDIVMQVTVRVPSYKVAHIIEKMDNARVEHYADEMRQKREALVAEIANIDAQLSK